MSLLPVLPQPKSVERLREVFTFTDATRIYLPGAVARPELLAAERLADVCEESCGLRPTLDRLGKLPPTPGASIRLEIKSPVESDPIKADGYRLEIRKDGVRLVGNSDRGLFYGLQTLTQLARECGDELPGAIIVDEPDFAWRGFYHDISRGKVPTMETLLWLVDYMAERKINMFQLYVEHPFVFRFDPSIAQGPDALTPDDVLLIDAYCRERHINFVPSLQSFGHMAGVFSLDQYRHLADVEMPAQWENLTWHQRMVGATINMSDPEALALMEQMHDTFLPLFTSEFVNVCADETYDLGQGKNKELAEQAGKDVLYLRHIIWLNELCKRYDRRMMFWGDIVKQHPERIPEIPKDTILLNWGYHRTSDFDSCKLFADADLDFFVCPGTSGWNRILNHFDNADLNIRRYVAAGKKYGAMGVLNTDWGDHGHFNLLSGSLHGLALGASMSWNSGNPEREDFDRIWNLQTFGIDDGRGIAVLRAQDDSDEWYLPTWRMLYQDFFDEEFLKKMSPEKATRLVDSGNIGADALREYLRAGARERWIVEEFIIASEINTLLGEKYLLVAELQAAKADASTAAPDLSRRLYDFGDHAERLYSEYREAWLARNKETDLRRIETMFLNLVNQARREAAALDQARR